MQKVYHPLHKEYYVKRADGGWSKEDGRFYIGPGNLMYEQLEELLRLSNIIEITESDEDKPKDSEI